MINKPQFLGLWDPFQIAFLWLINGGDTNYLLNGMILQVGRDFWMRLLLDEGGRDCFFFLGLGAIFFFGGVFFWLIFGVNSLGYSR